MYNKDVRREPNKTVQVISIQFRARVTQLERISKILIEERYKFSFLSSDTGYIEFVISLPLDTDFTTILNKLNEEY